MPKTYLYHMHLHPDRHVHNMYLNTSQSFAVCILKETKNSKKSCGFQDFYTNYSLTHYKMKDRSGLDAI